MVRQKQSAVKRAVRGRSPQRPYRQIDLDELLRAARAVAMLVTAEGTWRSTTERSALLIELRKTAAACTRLHELLAPGRPVRANPYKGAEAVAWFAGHAAGYMLNVFDGGRLARLREAGWTVAVHNDYRQSGMPMTFWLFTRTHAGGNMEAVKGEGATDAEALEQALERAGLS